MSHSDVKMRNLSCVRTHSHLRLFRCAVLCEHFDAIQRSAFLILAKASLGSIGGSKRALGTPPHPISFISMQFLAKTLRNNRFPSQTQELATSLRNSLSNFYSTQSRTQDVPQECVYLWEEGKGWG